MLFKLSNLVVCLAAKGNGRMKNISANFFKSSSSFSWGQRVVFIRSRVIKNRFVKLMKDTDQVYRIMLSEIKSFSFFTANFSYK